MPLFAVIIFVRVEIYVYTIEYYRFLGNIDDIERCTYTYVYRVDIRSAGRIPALQLLPVFFTIASNSVTIINAIASTPFSYSKHITVSNLFHPTYIFHIHIFVVII